MSVIVSVVVPARDEEDSIRALLDSLLQQTWPAAEIIVVDAGSRDRTAEIVRDYSHESARASASAPGCEPGSESGSESVPECGGESGGESVRECGRESLNGSTRECGRECGHESAPGATAIRLLTLGPAFPGIARNAGVEAASSELIAFTDAGIQLDRHWLERLCAPLLVASAAGAAPPDVVFGSYEPVTASFFGECAATAYVPARSEQHGKQIRGPFIASCLLRKSVFDAAGGFPPYRATEDLMFLEKLRDRNWIVAYAPHAIARWEMAAGWRSTFRRFRLYSYHNLIAGRGRYWHRGVARWYVFAMPFAILACVQRTAWLTAPVAGACARIGLTIWRKRKERWGSPFDPLRWIGVGLVLLTLDAATFSGAVWWAWDRCRGRLPAILPGCREADAEETPA